MSRASDLMTKSYHDHYHDMPWVDNRMRALHVSGALAETDWRHDAMLAAQVVTCIDLCAYVVFILGLNSRFSLSRPGLAFN